ncbi:NADH-quinone oxidoreductase subunit A [Demequina sediminis]|uniref:NADH-quinone oxidoreductase subunit A n=1 Tax=Demequina sediminis TaxID=1930058 RepID=UPI0025724857|nr:NADH-quinone oxidoreductase subunit A [Demequina sediminis]
MPIIVMMVIAGLLAAAGLLVSSMLGPKRANAAKLDQYESGLQPTPGAAGGGRIPIKYYLVAMTFIVFDIEVVFLYPWAVAHNALGWFGLIAIMTFLVLITIPFVYEWRRGGFEWD